VDEVLIADGGFEKRVPLRWPRYRVSIFPNVQALTKFEASAKVAFWSLTHANLFNFRSFFSATVTKLRRIVVAILTPNPGADLEIPFGNRFAALAAENRLIVSHDCTGILMSRC
jgi:hypothetical protein